MTLFIGVVIAAAIAVCIAQCVWPETFDDYDDWRGL